MTFAPVLHRALRVTAPASSANLGPGFDCLALALELRNELHVSPGSGRFSVEGEGAEALAADPTGNLVRRCFVEALGPDGDPDAWDLHCINRVPLARGLGSSTAAAAVGLAAGWTAGNTEWDPGALFARLTELDGHADNAAACTFGGLVAATTTPDLLVSSLPVPRWLRPVLLIPHRELATNEARSVLSDSCPLADATAQLAAASLMVVALASDDDDLLSRVLEADRLHELRRSRLVPELPIARALVSREQAAGSTLSGAGPTVLIWARSGHQEAVVDLLTQEIEHATAAVLLPAAGGVTVARHAAS